MGKRAREDPGGSGRRRPRVDLTRAADAAAAVEVQDLAPDYDAWNRNAAGPNAKADRDPVQAALAAKAARIQAMGPLGEHLAGYGEDDEEDVDGAGPHGTDRTRPDATEPAPPWTRLLDAKTNHPYFWNRATGATVWTLAETHTDVPRTEACPKNGEGGKQEHTTPGSEHFEEPDARTPNTTDDADDAPETRSVSGAKEKKAESRDAFGETATFSEKTETELETFSRRLEKTLVDAVTLSARSVLRREMTRLVRDDGLDTTEASELLRSRVPAIERAVERALGAENAKTEKDGETAKAETARTALLPRRATAFPPPLPDSPPPSPPPPPGAIARPPALRETLGAAGVSISPIKKKKTNDRDGPEGEKNSPLPPRTRACVVRVSRPPPPAVVERWRAARTAYEEEAEGADADPTKQAIRREAEVARWRERAARGEARDVAGNANLAPVAGDWRERAAAARLRRERLQAAADVEHTETHETRETHEQNGNARTSAAADAAAAAAGVDVAAASAGLPGGWRAFYDDKERSVYYGNAETGETRWDPPECGVRR